jgi:DNA (cytosine-5)-methyltransferase 1
LASKGLQQKVCLKEAISDLLHSNPVYPTKDRSKFYSGSYGAIDSEYQRLMRGGTTGNVPDSHSFAKHTEYVQERFMACLDLGIKDKNIASLLPDAHRNKKRTQFVLSPDLPSPTITTLPDDYIHYSEPRILTVRELARIQSFPDCFHFTGKYTTGGKQRKMETPRYTQVGNAIPPLFAELIGVSLKKVIK